MKVLTGHGRVGVGHILNGHAVSSPGLLPNILTNGFFLDGKNGWTEAGSIVFTVSGGTAFLENGAAAVGFIHQTFVTVASQVYDLSAIVDNFNIATTARISVQSGTSPNYNGNLLATNTAGILTTTFTASSASSTVGVYVNNGSLGASFEMAEIIINPQ